MATTNDAAPQTTPSLRDLSRSEQRKIRKQMASITMRAGEVLAQQGEHGHEFFLLVDGSVEISRDGAVVATMVATEDKGEFFGEISALTSQRRTATVVATEDITVEVMNRRQLAAVLDLWPDLAARVKAAAQERLAAVS